MDLLTPAGAQDFFLAFFFADFLETAFFLLAAGVFLAFPSLKMASHCSEYFFVVPLCNTVTLTFLS